MLAKINFHNISTLALFSVVLLLFMKMGSVFYDLKGVRLAMIVPFVFGFYYILTKKNTYLLIKRSQWILLTILMLSIYYLVSYGDNKLTLNLIFSYLLPFGIFIIAFYAGLENKQFILTSFLKILFVITIISLIPYALSGFSGSEISKKLAYDVYSTDASLIVFWPFLFLVSTFSFALINNQNKKYNKIFISLYVIIIISIVISSFTAAIILMLLTLTGYYFVIASQKNFFKMLLISLMSIATVISILYVISIGYFGDLGGSAKKINAFLMIIQTSDSLYRDDLLRTATSGRWAGYDISFRSFSESPLYGHGYSWSIINPISSQHSAILDNLAYFGLLSFIILMIYVGFTISAYKLCKLSNQKTELRKNAIFFGLLFGFLIINFVNPYFNFQTINEIIFLIGGWVTGNLRYLQKQNYLEVAASKEIIKI